MASVKHILAWVVVLTVVSMARADMVPFNDWVVDSCGRGVSVSDCSPPPVQNDPVLFSWLVFADEGLPSIGALSDAQMDVTCADRPQPMFILTDKQDSLGLSLYALVCLGLYKAAPWVKRLSVGVVPGWYHDGGPYQVGHSFAISPDCVHLMPVHCLVQLAGPPGDITPQYRQESIVASWRRSQFIPVVLACRAPPKSAVEPIVT